MRQFFTCYFLRRGEQARSTRGCISLNFPRLFIYLLKGRAINCVKWGRSTPPCPAGVAITPRKTRRAHKCLSTTLARLYYLGIRVAGRVHRTLITNQILNTCFPKFCKDQTKVCAVAVITKSVLLAKLSTLSGIWSFLQWGYLIKFCTGKVQNVYTKLYVLIHLSESTNMYLTRGVKKETMSTYKMHKKEMKFIDTITKW